MKKGLLGTLFTVVLILVGCDLLSKNSKGEIITTFSFIEPAVTGEITGNNIAVTVPFGTDVTDLVATFSYTGTNVTIDGNEQLSGTTSNDFTNPVVYTVTAEDSSTESYTVTVTVHEEIIIPDSGLLSYGDDTYKLWLPYNFEMNFTNEKYPLVISLHGGTTLTNHYFAPFIVNDEQEKIDYPCLFFAPNNSNKRFAENAGWIREVIHNMIEDESYCIDTNRIYIVGFSMGADGTTYMAQDLYDDYGYITAAIVPSGGGKYYYMSATALRDNTSMWIHYGLDGDYSQASDFSDAKTYNSSAVETVENDSVTYINWDGIEYTHNRETLTLTRSDGIEIAKRSTYEGMGHTSKGAFEDPKVLQWLFEQTLTNR